MRFLLLIPLLLLFACANRDGAEHDAPSFICTGTEPFWSLELDGVSALLQQVTMEPEPEQTSFAGGWEEIDEEGGVFVWSGVSETGEQHPFDVSITRESCQGTRDEPYEYQSSYGTGRPNGVFEPGCCTRRN